MKLTPKAIKAINQVRIRLLIALALNCTEQKVIKMITENDTNNDLTLAASMDVIRRETGLTDEEILDRELVTNS